MQDNNLLLLSDHPDDATFLAEVAQVSQANLHVAANAKDAVEFLSKGSCNAIFVDVSKHEYLKVFEAEAQKKLGLFSELLQANQVHFMGDKEIRENREVIRSPLFGSYFQRPIQNIEECGSLYGRLIIASNKKETNDVRHFLNRQCAVQSIHLSNTSQKQEAAEAVRQYLIAAKIPARISNIITNAVDELLMNAMFDAPCDDYGKHSYSSTGRDQARVLKEKETVTMSIGFDGFYVGVSVGDRFGSIDRSRLLNHVSANYRDTDYQIRLGQAGAGLGLANIHATGGSLIYHCEAKERTEATLLYRAYPSYKEFKNQFKFFSAKFYA